MLGASFVDALQGEFEVFATAGSDFDENRAQNFKIFDLKQESYDELISWSQPDAVVHCAALTNGNYCEQNPEEAFLVNGFSSKKLLEATGEQTRIIYVSTDAVFPSDTSWVKESDCPKPESVYGKSKELGEFFLLHSSRQVTVLRTTVVGLNINNSRSGFVEWILNSSTQSEQISLFDDVVFTPISIWKFIELTRSIILREIDARILHLVSEDSCTKYQFGIELLKSLGMSHDHIGKGSILTFSKRAKRSTDQTLSSRQTAELLKQRLPEIKEVIQDIKENIELWRK